MMWLDDGDGPAALWSRCADAEYQIRARWGRKAKVRCMLGPAAALWVIVSVTEVRDNSDDGVWFAVSIGDDGKLLRSPDHKFNDWLQGCGTGGLPPPHTLRFFDYDGDGDPELLTSSKKINDVSCGYDTIVRLYSRRGGALAPYADVPRVFEISDADEDGRPDLLFTPYDITIASGGYYKSLDRSWALLAHSLADGSFSRDDALAVAHAKALCPAAPSLQRVASSSDLPAAIHCGRLWGIARAQLSAAVESRCQQFQDSFCTNNRNAFDSMTRTKLPFTLR